MLICSVPCCCYRTEDRPEIHPPEQACSNAPGKPTSHCRHPYVIVGKVKGAHLVNLRKPWGAIRAADLDDVRLHDLRHSYASVALASGASLPMVGRLLGHTQSRTTAHYAHLTEDPIHELNQLVGDLIVDAMNGKKEAVAE